MPITMVIFVDHAHLSKKCRNYALLFTLNLIETPLYKLYDKQVRKWKTHLPYLHHKSAHSFPFSPKFRKFRLEIKWNGSSWFGPTGIFGTTFNLRVVHFDRSAHFGQLDQNAPFHLTKL